MVHDFCLTIPYGLLVVAGGAVGYLKRGSTASLAGGAASGLLLIIAGVLTLKAYEKRTNSSLGTILQTVVAVALTWVMGQRYLETAKIMPAGIVALSSGLMAAFYLYKFATGGNHFPAAKTE